MPPCDREGGGVAVQGAGAEGGGKGQPPQVSLHLLSLLGP